MPGLVVLAGAVALANLANPLGLHQNDEDFYVGVAREMLARGDWIVPVYMGEPSFHKPPLLYWLMAGFMGVLGPSLLAARLPIALMGVALALVTARLGKRLYGEKSAWTAGAMVATTVGYFQYARAAMMDVPLALCVVLAAWGARSGTVPGLYGAAVATAAGCMLKGPVGAALPILGVLLWWIFGERVRWPLKHLFGAAATFVALCGIWPALLAGRGLFSQWYTAFIIGENLGKFQAERDWALQMLWGFLVLLMPWTPLVLGALWIWARGRGWRDSDALLPVCIFAANFLLFSLPAIKWPQYLLPSIPMAALLVAWALRDGDAPRPVRVGGWVSALLVLATVPALLVAPRLFPNGTERVLFLMIASAMMVCAMLLVWRAQLAGAALAFAIALVGVSLLAPMVTLQRIPEELKTVTQDRELMTFGVPPYPYANFLQRSVRSHHLPEDFKQDFERGALIIVGDTEVAALMRGGAFNPDQAEMLLCWRKWRRNIAWPHVQRALREGRSDALQENVCVLARRSLPDRGEQR
ncbi:MAG: glycosyltransferase family 39 protein [Armatimonadetes bacterium]|nr:glycosyltransferase family 39 protein [Armatimonadota bacterium]